VGVETKMKRMTYILAMLMMCSACYGVETDVRKMNKRELARELYVSATLN